MLAVVLHVHAILAVYDDAATRREKREDRIVWNREATTGVSDEQSLGTRDRQWRGRSRAVFGLGAGEQPARHERLQALAESNSLVKLIEILHAQFAERGLLRLGSHIIE